MTDMFIRVTQINFRLNFICNIYFLVILGSSLETLLYIIKIK